MAIMLGWFNENENRSYPIAEDATGVDNDGNICPYSLIADLGISVPEDLVDAVYLRQITVTPAMVSVSFATSAGGLIVGTFARPVVPYQAYALTPVMDTASGFIVFGSAVNMITDPITYLFDSTDQSRIEENALSAVQTPGVTALGKLNGSVDDYTDGIIKIEVGTNVKVGRVGNTIQIGLVEAARSKFVGPCDQTAIFDSCGGVPIRTINGVPANGSGKITLEVD